MKTALLRAAALAAALLAPAAFAQPGPVALQPIANLAGVVEIVGRDGLLYLVQQSGRIRILDRATNAIAGTPFLDATGVIKTGGEQGLLGLAFPPDHATTGHYFVFHSAPQLSAPSAPGNDMVVARYTRSDNTTSAATRVEVIRIPHPTYENHNGGKIAFGPDGFLYIATGDGGSGGDPFNAAQNLNDLRGKLLRLDVRALPYAIPPGNPFAAGGGRAEIWAYGLRNPWRFSYDQVGNLYVADVGQNAWEEVNFIRAGMGAGANFGWRVTEGRHCYDPPSGCQTFTFALPQIEYGRALGESVTGGYVYHGRRVPELLSGHPGGLYYVYGDFVSGRIWAAAPPAGGSAESDPWTSTQIASLPNLSTFGEDENGDLYAANIAGPIVRFGPVDADGDGLSDAFEAAHFGNATAGDAALDSDGDGLSNLLEYRERRNPLAKDNDVFVVRRLLAMQQYRDFLFREGDEQGVRHWAGQVALAREIIAAFLGSAEFEGRVAPVTRLYFAYLQRFPDYAGARFWIGQLAAGVTLEAISQQFATSPEFTSRNGSLGNAEFIDRVYRNVLGRAPDGPGLAYWTQQLDSGAMNRGQVMVQFSESAEHRAVAANEVFVTMAYIGMLQREPDAAGFQHWVAAMDAGADRNTMIQTFFDAPEYRARFMP